MRVYFLEHNFFTTPFTEGFYGYRRLRNRLFNLPTAPERQMQQLRSGHRTAGQTEAGNAGKAVGQPLFRRRDELCCQEESSHLPSEHWQALRRRDRTELEQLCGVTRMDEAQLTLTVFDQEVRVQPARELVEIRAGSSWRRAGELLSLVVVVYLAYARNVPLAGRWVDKHQLGYSSFFQGRYRLPIDRLLARFGDAPDEFIERINRLGATLSGDDGDAAVRLWLLPKVPVKLILWQGDEDLPPALTILFDASIEQLLSADAIWAIVQLLSDRLLATR